MICCFGSSFNQCRQFCLKLRVSKKSFSVRAELFIYCNNQDFQEHIFAPERGLNAHFPVEFSHSHLARALAFLAPFDWPHSRRNRVTLPPLIFCFLVTSGASASPAAITPCSRVHKSI